MTSPSMVTWPWLRFAGADASSNEHEGGRTRALIWVSAVSSSSALLAA
jgi:hypothetical protein